MDDVEKIELEHDQLMNFCESMAAKETEAASDAGKRRKEIGDFLEKTGVQSKALAQIRSAMKLKKEGDRMDWLRSMEKMLPMVGSHIRGQGTMEMDLGSEGDGNTPEGFEKGGKFENDAFALGEQAFKDGKDFEKCPFRSEKDQVKASLWKQGFKKAEAAAGDEEAVEIEDDMTDEEVSELAKEMDEGLEGDDNLVKPNFGGQAG